MIIFIEMLVKHLYFAVAMVFWLMSCADLPKTNDTRFLGEPYVADEFENLDETRRKETEFKADSIIEKYNTKFAEDCTLYSEGQNQNPKKNKRLDCVTFK
ncbi:hypothetical protein R83H12_01058 [Fibrobacteria bacterium R8-3-H12]